MSDTAAPIEGEVIESRAVVVAEETGIAGAGTFALAALTDQAFEARLDAMVKHRQRVQRIQRALMTKDVHYGIIPGTDKPTLLQPGAELLCDVYRLRARFVTARSVGDGVTVPHLSYLTECYLHLGSLDGPVVAHATGTANSWEKRYRWRNADRTCPTCGKATVFASKRPGEGFYCWRKKGGCGATFPEGSPAIVSQVAGQVENPDPFDLDVVLDAMATKRAFVHATRRGCAVSDLFTSDVEDLPGNEPEAPEPAPVEPAPPPSRGESEELLGVLTKAGTVKVGTAMGYKLEAHQTPNGYAFGFRLEVDGDRAIPQVLVEGPLAADVLDALGGKPETLAGKWAKVRGRLFNVSVPGKSSYYRLRVQAIETADWKLPADPPEAPSVPLFTADEEAELDAAVPA